MAIIYPVEAVNQVLEAIGQPPVSDAEKDTHPDSIEADGFLLRADNKIQRRGWHFNMFFDVALAFDGNGNIATGDILRIIAVKYPWRVAIRNSKLYDLENETIVFTAEPTVSAVRKLTWFDLPWSLQQYIITDAAVTYQRYKRTDQVDDAVLRDNLAQAKLQAVRDDEDLRQTNLLQTDEHLRLKGWPYR